MFDNFGWSVAISGDTLVVGALLEEQRHRYRREPGRRQRLLLRSRLRLRAIRIELVPAGLPQGLQHGGR
ncbi:MAG: FG-GAP repeat protein [Planctomycetota bacterium]